MICQLHVDRQRSAHAVDVDLVRVQALGLEEELVLFLVGKLDDLVFDRRAVARPDRLNLPAVHGRAVDVLADDAMRLRRGVTRCSTAPACRDAPRAGAEAERRGIASPGCRRTSTSRCCGRRGAEASRSSGGSRASPASSAIAQQHGGRLAAAAGGILLFAAMNQPVEKRSGGDDDRLRAHGAAIAQLDADDSSVVGPDSRR